MPKVSAEAFRAEIPARADISAQQLKTSKEETTDEHGSTQMSTDHIFSLSVSICVNLCSSVVKAAYFNLALAANAELLHFGLQGGALHSQPRCRALRAANDPVGFFQRAQDVFAFGVMKCGEFRDGSRF